MTPGPRLPRRTGRSIFGAVLGHTLVVVSDAHLGVAPPAVEEALLAFLEAVPDLGDCLLVNGDLFDFWFSYAPGDPPPRLPRRGGAGPAPPAGADRDGRRQPRPLGRRLLGAGPRGRGSIRTGLTFDIGGRRVAAIHGDGLTEPRLRATLLHRVINHPDHGRRLPRASIPRSGSGSCDLLSPHLGDHTPDDAAPRGGRRPPGRVGGARCWRAEPELGLLVMGHTHLPALRARRSRGGNTSIPAPGSTASATRVATERGAELRHVQPSGTTSARPSRSPMKRAPT